MLSLLLPLLPCPAGMHGIVLSFDNDSQLEQSTRFLQKVHPLNYTAAIKKSQVCGMLLGCPACKPSNRRLYSLRNTMCCGIMSADLM